MASGSRRSVRRSQALVTESQKNVTGTVRLKLYKGNIIAAGRKSPVSLYNPHIATMEADPTQAYNQDDATGFIRLNALRLKVAAESQRRDADSLPIRSEGPTWRTSPQCDYAAPVWLGFRGGLLGGRLSLFEFEANLVALELEKGREWLALFGDETRDEVGLSRFDELDHLLARDFALANRFPHPEFAFARVAALIGIPGVVDRAGLADRAGSNRRKRGEIDRLSVSVGCVAKIEDLLELSIKLDDG